MKKFPIWLIVIILVIVSGCNSINGNLSNEFPTPTTILPTVAQPTLTPKPDETPVILFYADPESNENSVSTINSILQTISEKNSMIFELRLDFNNLNFPDNIFAFVILSEIIPIEELNSLPSNVIIISIGSLIEDNPNPNIMQIGITENGLAAEGFVAGYIAAMQTNEWRIGMIGFTSQSINRIGFLNGAKYFCGLCSPLYPPYSAYPLYVEVNDGADFDELKVAVDLLLEKEVNTIYLAPGVNNSELVGYLSQLGISMIGNEKPTGVDDGLWVASVKWDWVSVLEEMLPQAILGNLFETIAPDIQIDDVNENEISPSRQVLISEITEFLLDGIVDPIGQ